MLVAFTHTYQCTACNGRHGYDSKREIAEPCPLKSGPPSRNPQTQANEKPGSALVRAVEGILTADLGYRRDTDYFREFCWAVDEGRDFRGDFVFLTRRVIVECKGGAHAVKRQAYMDYDRDTLAAALGYRMAHVHRGMCEKPGLSALLKRVIEYPGGAANGGGA